MVGLLFGGFGGIHLPLADVGERSGQSVSGRQMGRQNAKGGRQRARGLAQPEVSPRPDAASVCSLISQIIIGFLIPYVELTEHQARRALWTTYI